MIAKPILIALFALSALLPTVGFVRLFIRASKDLARAERIAEERGSAAAQLRDLSEEYSDITAKPRAVKKQLVWDSLFVFVGLGCGAVASILSLP